jgi:hypothetical protein
LAAAALRRLRRFGAAAAFFAFLRAAMVHPLVDESDPCGRSRGRTVSPFVGAVKSMFRSYVGSHGPGPADPTDRLRFAHAG